MSSMQNDLFSMIQTITVNNKKNNCSSKKESAKNNSFEQCIKEYTNSKKQETVLEDENVNTNKGTSKKEELDITLLQQLAAMQMVNITPEEIVVPQEVISQQTVVGEVEIVIPEDGKQQNSNVYSKDVPTVEVDADGKIQEQVIVEDIDNSATKNDGKEGLEHDFTTKETKVEKSDVKKQGSFESEDVEIKVEAEESIFGKLETIPVKVSETTNTEKSSEAKNVETQVVEKVVKTISSGESKVELQLNPEHLGKISIEVTQKEDGSLSIALTAEHSSTKNLLERIMPEMQQMLRSNTQQNVQIQVYEQEHHQEMYDEQHHNNQQGHNQENEHHQRNNQKHNEDFLNQLRLGLVHTVDFE